MENNFQENAKLIIEPLSEADLDWVTKLEAETFSLPWSREAFAEEIGHPDRLFVVAKLCEEGGPDPIGVGYSGMFLSFDEGEITNVAINPAFRGKGFGQQMLAAQMEMAGQKGVHSFTLEVRVSNQNAIRLYEKLGFQSVGVRRNFYEKPTEDAMIMWKR